MTQFHAGALFTLLLLLLLGLILEALDGGGEEVRAVRTEEHLHLHLHYHAAAPPQPQLPEPEPPRVVVLHPPTRAAIVPVHPPGDQPARVVVRRR